MFPEEDNLITRALLVAVGIGVVILILVIAGTHWHHFPLMTQHVTADGGINVPGVAP